MSKVNRKSIRNAKGLRNSNLMRCLPNKIQYYGKCVSIKTKQIYIPRISADLRKPNKVCHESSRLKYA